MEAYSESPESLADFKGSLCGLWGWRKEKGAMEGKGKEGRGRNGSEDWKGSWSRAANWLRPALGIGSKLYNSNFQTPKSKLPRT